MTNPRARAKVWFSRRSRWPASALLLAAGCLASPAPDGRDDGAPPAPDLGRAGADPDLAAAPDAATLEVNGCAGGDGTIGAIFRGVPVYCQAHSVSGYYQCDELANRFLRDALAHPNLDDVVTEFASSLCGKAAARPEYSTWGPGFQLGAAPVAGDLIVWPGMPGHVAVVTSADSASVEFVQQNVGIPTGAIGWDAAAGYFAGASPECWIHPEPSAPAPWPSGADCGCFDGDGDYCGLAVVNHEHWNGCVATIAGGGRAAYDTLYRCALGVFTAGQVCRRCFTPLLEPATGACAE